MNKRKRIIFYIKIIDAFLVVFSIIAVLGIGIAHKIVFERVDYEQYDSEHNLLYSDLDEKQYPRDTLQIQSGKNILTGYLYGINNTNGLIIISPGHTDASDIKLYEITYFVDNNWKVLCYDYTGCYNSQGSSMVGYTQSVHDLDAVLTYVENCNDYKEIPIVLFGHSLGGYASAAVLQYGHSVNAAIIASGFDTPKQQWTYSIERYTGVFHYVLKDLLFPGNKEYAPDKCCIIPQTLNTMLSNCKKHKSMWKNARNDLPLGVRYDSGMDMYYGEIKPCGHDEVIRLSYWGTPEDAFEEYKRHKQADILIMADKYKNKVPKKVYDALLRFEVKPYIED